LTADGVTACRIEPLVALLDARGLADSAVDDGLLSARVDPTSKKPSVEAMFHAWLLTLPGVNFVGHTHPVAVNAILCTKHARTFATRRMCPDEIVCCGAEFVFVPYVDPGLKLAQAIRRAVLAFVQRLARPRGPRTRHEKRWRAHDKPKREARCPEDGGVTVTAMGVQRAHHQGHWQRMPPRKAISRQHTAASDELSRGMTRLVRSSGD
jgi:hypothetical protein